MIRLLGALCFCLGALVMIHDLGTFAYGEADDVALAVFTGEVNWLQANELLRERADSNVGNKEVEVY